MKQALIAIFIIPAVLAFLFSCAEGPGQAEYTPELPAPPDAWKEILGRPCWLLQWLDGGGNGWTSLEGEETGEFPAIPLIMEGATPVLAWPYWPEKGVMPGQMRPAGALFPWDASGGRIILSWKGGVDAVFWRELAAASNNPPAQKAAASTRFPWHFNWPGFRELMNGEDIPGEIKLDPWLADWKSIAGKTVENGFDRRRIKEAPYKESAVPFPEGVWVNGSPFAPPLEAQNGKLSVIKTGETASTWVSSFGAVRCQKNTWTFLPFSPAPGIRQIP